jgi:two-component system, response regulator PdtaR
LSKIPKPKYESPDHEGGNGGASDGPQRTVLVVESNELLKLCLFDLLESAGFGVVHADNGDEALLVLNARSDIALLLTNVVMSGSMDGVELAHVVASRWPSLEIIVASGKRGLSEADLPSKGLFFAKPYHDEEILFEIRALIRQSPDK